MGSENNAHVTSPAGEERNPQVHPPERVVQEKTEGSTPL